MRARASRVESIVLGLVGILAWCAAAPRARGLAAPRPSIALNCETVLTFLPPFGYPTLTCVNSGCVAPCRQVADTLPGSGRPGLTCSCYGLPPDCCHLVVARDALDAGSFNGTGSCSSAGCRGKDPCRVFARVDRGVLEVRAGCGGT